VHAGIGPQIHTIAQIEAIERPITSEAMPDEVTMLLWADPNPDLKWFGDAIARACGCQYGMFAVRDFLNRNKCEYIIRGHECVDGIHASSRIPVITVFSASNYQIGTNNRSGVLQISATGELVFELHPPIERLQRADALFFSFGRRRMSDSRSDRIVRSEQSFMINRHLLQRRGGLAISSSNLTRALLSDIKKSSTSIPTLTLGDVDDIDGRVGGV
jgi:hypothetical protein